jgi:hypothetical protein
VVSEVAERLTAASLYALLVAATLAPTGPDRS